MSLQDAEVHFVRDISVVLQEAVVTRRGVEMYTPKRGLRDRLVGAEVPKSLEI